MNSSLYKSSVYTIYLIDYKLPLLDLTYEHKEFESVNTKLNPFYRISGISFLSS